MTHHLNKKVALLSHMKQSDYGDLQSHALYLGFEGHC